MPKTNENLMLSNSKGRVNLVKLSTKFQIIRNGWVFSNWPASVFCRLHSAIISYEYIWFSMIEIVHQLQNFSIYLNLYEKDCYSLSNFSLPFRRSSMASTEVSRASFTSSFWSIWSSSLLPRWRWDSASPQDSCISYVRMPFTLTSTYMIVHSKVSA